MAILVRGTSTSQGSGSGTGVTATGTIPAGTQTDDLVVAAVWMVASGATIVPPAGWTVIDALNSATSAASILRAARHRATSGEAGASVAIVLGVTCRWLMNVISVYSDDGQRVSVEQATAYASSGQTASPPSPAITPFAAGTLILAAPGGASRLNGQQPTMSAPAGWTVQVQGSSTRADLKNAFGALGTRTWADTTQVPSALWPLAEDTAAPACGTIVLSATNVSPVANAGPDQAVGPGDTVTLTGAGSTDPDGTLTGYTWTQVSGPSVTLSSASVVSPTFTAPSIVDGATLVFGLTVTDDRSATSAQDTVTVTVGSAVGGLVRVSGAWTPYAIQTRYRGAWV